MPVTKTAKRALRGSLRKRTVNTAIISQLEIAVRLAKRTKGSKAVRDAISLADRAAKTNVLHKNKAARLVSQLSTIARPVSATSTKPSKKKTKASKK